MTTTQPVEDTLITRIANLLNMAETTKNEHEREAFMAKAQEIATRSAIDLDRARFLVSSNLRKPVLIQKRTTIGELGSHGLFTYVKLYLAIAHANNVTCNIAHKSNYVIAFGFDTDIEVVEMLYLSLMAQMVDASNAYLASDLYKSELVHKPESYRWSESKGRYVYKPAREVPVHGKTARLNFQEAFAARVGHRLQVARAEAEAAAVDEDAISPEVGYQGVAQADSVSLVLVRKAEAVQDFYKAQSKAKGSWGGGSKGRAYSSNARSAGDSAGRKARLTNATAIGGTRQAVSA